MGIDVGTGKENVGMGKGDVGTEKVVCLFLTSRGEVGTVIVTWLGRVVGKGAGYVSKMGKT